MTKGILMKAPNLFTVDEQLEIQERLKSNDIEVATGIARDMITVYGMSSSLGPISLKVDEPYELQMFGEDITDEVGNQVKQLVDTAYIQAQKILLDNIDILHRVATTLLEKETISEK